ncbi:hypothetical protein [Sphingosinicella sp. BN140058]|uniref:hypothetical protein n=1 Tax=Sphingosinicella sp. BN140058 TaxID=1892855 RepID=UPI001011452F|nr:hypothetical protein [Sphingosinicella sp. BN140058]QAY77908.1 hypothetical protein ETR14_16305 [Sphingosinicella sp. BN140058]
MRRSFAEIRAIAQLDERHAVLAYTARQCDIVEGMADAGKIGREEADLLCARLKAFAKGIKNGFHIEGPNT